MHRQTNAALAPHGATAEQFVILAILAEQDGVTQQELGRRATSDPNTIRATLLLLEDRALVTRRQHPTDGRARCVILTPKGRQTYTKLSTQLKPLQEQLRAALSPAQARSFVVALGRIAEAMSLPNDPQARPRKTLKGEKP
jgi:DNA-binding MarR family transcriptional regulator